MAFKDLLTQRTYPESFTDEGVERDKLAQLLECCRWVSSPDRLQCIELVVVDDDEIKEQFRTQIDVPACPVFISVLGNMQLARSSHGEKAEHIVYTEIGGMLETMTQQATEAGLSVQYMVVDDGPVKQALHIPEHFDASTLVLVGYADDMYTTTPTRFRVTDIAYMNEYGEKVKAFYDAFEWKGAKHYMNALKKKVRGEKGIR